MLEQEALLTATAAMLLLLALHQVRPVRAALGRRGFLLALGGTLLPLLDLPLRFAQAPDRIGLLAADARFYALYPTACLLGALGLLAAAALGASSALRMGGAVALGYGLHLLLTLLTPVGARLFWPFSDLRVALPLMPAGHVLIVGVLATGVLAGEALPRLRRRFTAAAAVLVALYTAFAAGEWAMLHLQARRFEPRDVAARVEPEDALLRQWAVVKETAEGYHLWRWHAYANTLTAQALTPRSNEPGVLAWIMADPTVRHIYFRLFRNPVAHVEVSNSQFTLVVQELADVAEGGGRSLHVDMDPSGGGRFYELERFY
ncbi:MAG: hypothetical protein HY342_06450 [Candidatus Lambdaproteobacteria bacterium]|nr:hypothetical protein [Candidatus Lambdaproteobacteria bacterium]